MNRELEGHSLWAWTAAAFLAPAAWFLGSAPWVWVLGLGAPLLLLWMIGAGKTGTLPPWLAALELAFLLPVISMAASKASDCWLGARATAAFPLVLLVLAACSASQGTRAGARGGAVLFWFAGGMFLVLTCFGLPEVRWEYLAPRHGSISGQAAFVLTLPAVSLLLPRRRGHRPWQWAGLLLLGALSVSILSVGILSPTAAEDTAGAYFQMARGIRILGVAERFEALVAAALTIGWFCLLSLLLSAAGHMAECIRPGWGKIGVPAAAACAWGLQLLGLPFGGWLSGAMGVLMWLLVPLLFFAH